MLDDVTNLGERIKELRKDLKMTQSAFGKLFDPPATKGIVSKWESGKSVPSEERLKKLSQMTGMSVENLVYGSLKGALAKLLSHLLDFWKTLEKEDSNENWDANEYLKQFGIEGQQPVLAAFEIVTTIQNDSYVEKPARLDELDKLASESDDPIFYISQKDADLYDSYNLSNFKAGLKYCGQDTLKKAKEIGVKSNQTDILLSMLLNSAKQHIVDVRVDNNDIISYSFTGLENLTYDIKAHIKGFEYHGQPVERLPKSVNENLIKDLNEIFSDAKEKILRLNDKYKS